MAEAAIARKRRRSERGNWLVVHMVNGRIQWCTWVRTWAGVEMSRRAKEEFARAVGYKSRVFVLDIERMLDFAITEGANEITDLHRLFGLDSLDEPRELSG